MQVFVKENIFIKIYKFMSWNNSNCFNQTLLVG